MQAWKWQKSLVHKVIDASEEGFLGYIIILQHTSVYTLGEGSTIENLKFETDDPPFPLYRIERGGEVTYHGPGQLVMYPIINLKLLRTDLHWYLRNLEEMIIRYVCCASNLMRDCVSSFICLPFRSLDMVSGIQGERIDGLTGVWVDDKKVAAIGIRASKWVTYHGIALNVTTDLSPFDNIVPCGIQDKDVTRVGDLIEDPSDDLLIEYRYGLLEGFASAFELDSSEFLEISGHQALGELNKLIY